MSPAHTTNYGTIALPPGVTGATVLVAGSNGYTTSLEQALAGGGYEVVCASTVSQALELVVEYQPHLVITAERLPDGSGGAVCYALKNRNEFIPIILLGGEEEPLDVEDPDILPDAVLPYPVAFADLEHMLSVLLRMKQKFDRRAAQLAAAADRVETLKEQIIEHVSHELKTPLLQVKSALAFLTEEITQQPEIGPQHMATMATLAVARLEAFVSNIDQLAKMHDIRLGPAVVIESAELAVRLVARSWDSHNAEARVRLQIDRSLAPVTADKRALGYLLRLLIENGLKFSAEDDPVHVIAERVTEEEVWIGVQDFGIGIPPEEHERIFEAFYQVDGSSTRRYPGAGTGLALATLLAESMHTRIEVASAPNSGSTFSFTLPVADLQHPY